MSKQQSIKSELSDGLPPGIAPTIPTVFKGTVPKGMTIPETLPRGKISDLVTCPYCKVCQGTVVKAKIKSPWHYIIAFADNAWNYKHYCSRCKKLITVDKYVEEKQLSDYRYGF
eukprot:255581_1